MSRHTFRICVGLLLCAGSLVQARAGTATSPEIDDPSSDVEPSVIAHTPLSTDTSGPGDQTTVDVRSIWFEALRAGSQVVGFTVHMRLWNSIATAKPGTGYSVWWTGAGGCDDVPQGADNVRGVLEFKVGSGASGKHDCGSWFGTNNNEIGSGCFCESFVVDGFRQVDSSNLEWDILLSDLDAGLGQGAYGSGSTLSNLAAEAVTRGLSGSAGWDDQATSSATFTLS